MSALSEQLECSRCELTKPVAEFYRRSSRRRGFSSECKACHKSTSHYRDPARRRDDTLRRRYGIGTDEYDALYEKQGGRCAFCGGTSNGRGRLAVDHDHATGRVRGLLCFTCNTALGRLEAVGLSRVQAYVSGDLGLDVAA